MENWRTLEELRGEHLAGDRLLATLGGAFAVLALLQMAAGLVGVVAFWVARRNREMGLRLALGARPANLFRLVIGQCMVLVAAGLVLGLLASIGVVKGLGSMLYGIQPTDTPTFLAVVGAMVFLAYGAASWPAHRATRVDPVAVLREE